MRKIKQFRLNDGYNPSSFCSGNAFNGCYPIVQLKITAAAGTKFYINKGIDGIIIGPTEEYFIKLSDSIAINHLSFDKASLSTEKNITVDIIYDN